MLEATEITLEQSTQMNDKATGVLEAELEATKSISGLSENANIKFYQVSSIGSKT